MALQLFNTVQWFYYRIKKTTVEIKHCSLIVKDRKLQRISGLNYHWFVCIEPKLHANLQVIHYISMRIKMLNLVTTLQRKNTKILFCYVPCGSLYSFCIRFICLPKVSFTKTYKHKLIKECTRKLYMQDTWRKRTEYSRLHPIYLHMLWPININDTQAHVKVIIVHNSRIPHFVLFFKVLKFREWKKKCFRKPTYNEKIH